MLAFLVVALTAAPEPLPNLDAFLADFSRKRESVHALKAEFAQENITSDESDTVAGSLFYAHPRRILFRYPEAQLTYAFDDLRVYEYDAQAQQVQIHDIGDDPQTEALFVGFGENTASLRAAYDIELFRPDASDCGTIGMTLKPKDESSFKEVRLFLEGDHYLPCRVKIVNDEDSTVLINMGKYEINPTFAPRDTQMEVAEGSEVFQNDQHRETAGPDGLLLPEEPVAPSAAPKPAAAP